MYRKSLINHDSFSLKPILLLAFVAFLSYTLFGLTNSQIFKQAPQILNSSTVSSQDTQDEWETYHNEDLKILMKHPPDIVTKRVGVNAVNFYTQGPAQKNNTKLSDGISLSIVSEKLENSSLLENVVASDAKDLENLGEISQGPVPIIINNFSGYMFRAKVTGDFTYIYLEDPVSNRYVKIVNGTADPANKGYEEIVNMMISTLELISTT